MRPEEKMSEPFDIITIGFIFNENIQFPDSTIGPLLGATVSYSSTVLGMLGAKVGIVSNVGRDIPKSLLKPIYASHVDTAGLHISDNSVTTTTLLVYNKKGFKNIKYLKKAPKITFKNIPTKYLNTKLVYFCSVDFDVLPDTLKKIKSLGLTTAADMGGFGGAHNSEETMKEFIKDRAENLRAYTKHIDIAKVSMEDCYHLFGQDNITEGEALKRLRDNGIKIAIMTLGEKGAIAATEGGMVKIPPVPSNVIDTTGAGDTFMAAFLLEYIRTSDIYRSGLFAAATASILIEKTGGVTIERIPEREQVLKRLRDFGDL